MSDKLEESIHTEGDADNGALERLAAMDAPAPAPVPEPELSPKDKAEAAIQSLEKWHENDDRFRRRLDEIRAYIARLEGIKAGVASVQPGPDLFPKEEPSADKPDVKFGSKSKR